MPMSDHGSDAISLYCILSSNHVDIDSIVWTLPVDIFRRKEERSFSRLGRIGPSMVD
jgi:hypothetical protein